MTADDTRWMQRCLELAERGAGRVSPNPMVGCVILDRRGRLVAEGYHQKLGGPHAEAEALAQAGARAKNGTMYVSLEPCRHRGNRRTEPCAPKVAAAGLARVVVGAKDPIPSHGGGAAWLRRQGIEVTTGVLADRCRELNRGFFIWATERRPWFVLKAGVTLDGRIATRAGQSQWITGAASRKDVHRLRARLDAILVGVNTVIADDPRLTCRGVARARDPIRVVLDSALRTPPKARLLPANSSSKARVLIATTASGSERRAARLERAGAEIVRVPGRGARVSLRRLARMLAAREVASVLVEGGAGVHGAMMAAELIDDVYLYVAPMLFGGPAPSWLGGEGVAQIERAPRLQFFGEPRRLGDDLLLVARPVKAGRRSRSGRKR